MRILMLIFVLHCPFVFACNAMPGSCPGCENSPEPPPNEDGPNNFEVNIVHFKMLATQTMF